MPNNNADGSVIIDIKANTDDFEKKLSSLDGIIERVDVDKKIIKLDGIIEHTFGQLLADAIRGATSSMQDLVQEVYNTGVSFESAFAGVKKTVDETATTSYDDLNNSLREMAKNMPAAYEEIAGVAEAAGQLGIATDNITDFTKVMVDLGNSTNLSAEMAASELAKFANVTKMSSDDYDKLGSAIVHLGNNMATTEADIVNMSQRLGATASVAGIAQPDILALSAALSSVGVEAEAGGTAMATFIKKMQTAVETGNENLSRFAEVADMSEEAFAELFRENGAQAIDAFIRGLHRIDEEGGSALTTIQEMGFKEVRLSNAILALANNGDILTNSINLSNQAWKENTALAEEAEKRYETTESKMAMLRNTVRDFYYDISQSVMDDLGGFMDLDKIGDMLERIKDKVEKGNLGETLGRIAEKMLELAEAGANFAIDEGLPKLLDVLEWISTHGDELIAVIKGIAATMVADKMADYAEKVYKVAKNYDALVTASQSVTKVTSESAKDVEKIGKEADQAAALVNVYVLALEAAAIAAQYLASKLDEAGQYALDNAKYLNGFTDSSNDAWEAYRRLAEEFKTNPIGVGNESAANLEADKKTLASYKEQLAEVQARYEELDAIRENNNSEFLINGYDEELIALGERKEQLERNVEAYTNLIAIEEKYSKYAGEEVKTWRDQLKDLDAARNQGLVDDTAYWRRKKEILEKNRHMENHDWQVYMDEVTQHYRNAGKTEAKAQASLEDELKALEIRHSKDKVNGTADDNAYWAKRKAILEAHRNEEDENWRKLYIEVQEHYQKLSDEEKAAQDKANAEAERERTKAEREREAAQNKYNRAIDDIYTDAQRSTKEELNEVKKNFDAIASEYSKGYDRLIKERDAYKNKLMGGSIFQVIQKKDKETGEQVTEYTIDDLKERIKKQTKYAQSIKELRDRGLSEALIAELESMGMDEGGIFAKQIAQMSEKEFADLNSAYEQLDKATTDAANARYQSEIEALQTNYADEVRALYDGLSQDIKDTGLLDGMNYIQYMTMGIDDGSTALAESIDAAFEEASKRLENDMVDLGDSMTETLRDQGYGDAVIDNIIDAVDRRKQEVQDSIKDMLTSTNIDLDIQTDMQARAAAQSQSGYAVAKSQADTSTAETTSSPTSSGTQQTVKVELQLTERGKGVIADIVSEETKKKEIEVNA